MEALAFVFLSGLYIVSNRDNTTSETFVNSTEDTLEVNYPVVNHSENKREHRQHTDKYFNGTKSAEPPVGGKPFIGLTGEAINTSNFNHSNMKPFFGGKIKGGSYTNNSESLLDNLQGGGSHAVHKSEQAPLFKPQKSMSHIYGAPNDTDFMRSRVNPSMRASNTKPWEEQRVAPGLGQGYTNTCSNLGYNNGMEHRDKWLPPTVDQLRVDTNPKQSYDLSGYEGPAGAHIKEYCDVKSQGTIEKRTQDTDYELGPGRWFTTTGQEKGQPVRGTKIMQDQNRSDTTRDYYGNTTRHESATYVTGDSSPVHRQQLKTLDNAPPNAMGKGASLDTDHGKSSYNSLPNNRQTTRNEPNLGSAYGTIKAIVSPMMDMVLNTKKENFIDHMRPVGNVQAGRTNSHLYDKSDKTKVTIREQTGDMIGGNYLNVQNQDSDAYMVTEVQQLSGNRSEMNVDYVGNAGPSGSTEIMNYDAAYRQNNNTKKTHYNRPNQGGMSMLNHKYNMNVTKDDNSQYRKPAPRSSIQYAPDKEILGVTSYVPDFVDINENKRNDPNLLKAFKENPFTQSLNSY